MAKRSTMVFFTTTLAMTGNLWAQELVVDQKNRSFVKDGAEIKTLDIKVGDVIRFKNEDPFFHSIFSESETAKFDLGNYPKGQSKTVTFEKAGKVDIECAIHSKMHLTVNVK
ncbi:MAG: methylamine utilization protein [Pseudomonadota bacterium]